MYRDSQQIVYVSMSVQTDVYKTGDNLHCQIGDAPTPRSISVLEFEHITITLEQLLSYLKQGKCIGQIYFTDPYCRKRGYHISRDWRGTCWIGVDIDDSEVDMQTMFDELFWKPTFCMTTQSHMKPGHTNRYRLFYFFSSVMHNYEGLCRVADRIIGDVRRVVQNHGDTTDCIDDNNKSKKNFRYDKARFYYGNPYESQVLAPWNVYNPTEIYPAYEDKPDTRNSAFEVYNPEKPEKEVKVFKPDIWNQLCECCLNPKYNFERIVKRFHKYYHIRFKTPVDYQDNGKAFTLPPENYMYLRFRWENKPAVDGVKPKSVILKWCDGEHRRKKLFVQLCLIAYMNQFELTIDQLVFHAIYLFHIAYCNLDKQGKRCYGKNYITPAMVMDKACQVYQLSEKEIEKQIEAEVEKDKPAFIVSRLEAEKWGMSVLQLLGEARHQYTEYLWQQWEEILEPYVKLGWNNKQLAEKLEEEIGVERSKDNVGRHMNKYRDRLRKRALKAIRAETSAAVAPLSLLNFYLQSADNEWFAKINLDFFRGFFDININNFLFHASPTVQTARPSTALPASPNNVLGGILSRQHQIGVNNKNEARNIARAQDKLLRRQLFMKHYDPTLKDGENRKKITTLLGISNSTYYLIKRELIGQ